MAKKTIKSKVEMQVPASVLGLIVSWAITVILLCVGVIFIENEYIEIKNSMAMSLVILFLSVLTGCLVAKKADPINAMKNIIIAFGSYIMSLIICGMLFFDGLSGSVLGGVLVALAGGLAAILIENKGNNRALHKKRRSASR